MQNSRNPGLFAIAIGVALAVLFALLGFTGVLEGRLAFGLAAICVIVPILLYIFYRVAAPLRAAAMRHSSSHWESV